MENYDLNKDSVKCINYTDDKNENYKNPIKCSFEFNKLAKIEFYFQEEKTYIMKPFRIKTLEKINGEWKIFKQLDYLEFNYDLNKIKQVDARLPTGFGCENKLSL